MLRIGPERFEKIRTAVLIHARFLFRRMRCKDTADDLICESLAHAWQMYLRSLERGKDPTAFPTMIATFACGRVRNGRWFAGKDGHEEVLSWWAQQRYGFGVEPIPAGQRLMDEFEEHLQHNVRTPIADQVEFRLDFSAWLGTRTRRERRIIGWLANGKSTGEVAAKLRTRSVRINELRREYRRDYDRFVEGDPDDLA